MVGLCSFVKGVLIWLRFFRFDLWRDMRLREKEREFGQRREEATIGGGGCDANYACRFGLVSERDHHSVGFSLISIFF